MDQPSISQNSDNDWDMIIRPQRSWWDLRLGEIWKYRGLIRMLVWRDFASAYKQTALGPLYYFTGPIFSALTFLVIFTGIAKISTGDTPPMLFYLSGMMLWSYFSAVLTRTSTTLLSNTGLFNKVYFPRLVMPIAAVISAMLGMALQFLTFAITLLFYVAYGFGFHLTAWVLLLPFYTLISAGLGMGIGLIFASTTIRYRDFQQFIGPGLQLAQYSTPIVYQLSSVPGFLRPMVSINPMVPLVQGFRAGLLSNNPLPSVSFVVYAIVISAAVLLIGIVLFNRAQSSAADSI